MQMNKLTAGRPSATKSKLSVADVSEQGRNHSGSAEWFN